jgi:glycosyltransferase involved in cell wall biosynthesis
MGSLNEAMRSWGQWASRLDPFVNRTLRQANIILAANSATRDFFPQSVARKVRIMLIAGSQEMLPRAEFVEQPDPFRLLWVGYFTAWKGLPLLLEALAQIKSEIRTSLTIVGDGPESQRWRRLVCQLGLVDTVQFLGKLPHKDTLRRYQEVDAFVFTSLHDSSGNVLHEAMSSGLPLIVLDWAGPHDIVIENCGIKIRPESPAQVVQDLALSIKALARDPNRRKSMGEASRQRFVGEFDWNKKAKEMTRIYELVRQR